MKKKELVLWAAISKRNHTHFIAWPSEAQAVSDAEFRTVLFPSHAPFRVVKYLPAPKPKRKRKA